MPEPSGTRLEEKLDDIKERLIVIETQMGMISNLGSKLESVTKTSDEALQSTRSAHKRIDKFESNVTWLWRSIGAGFIASLISGIIYLLKKSGV